MEERGIGPPGVPPGQHSKVGPPLGGPHPPVRHPSTEARSVMPTPRKLISVPRPPDGIRHPGRRYVLIAAALLAASVAPAVTAASTASAAPARTALGHHSAVRPAIHQPGAPDFGPNVYVFTPSMPQSQIQATVDSIASQQVGNQFGTQRYALLFEP